MAHNLITQKAEIWQLLSSKTSFTAMKIQSLLLQSIASQRLLVTMEMTQIYSLSARSFCTTETLPSKITLR